MRLFAALTVSCLLHAAFVFLPYFGASSADSRAAARGAQEAAPARKLSVKLVELVTERAPPAADNAAARASIADPPALRMADEEPLAGSERALGTGVLPIPAPTYYTSDRLTKRPRATSEPRLDVPELGPVFPYGKVVLKVWISELGKVVSVDVEKSDVPDAVAASAASAFGKLRFEPGEINGRRVGSMMRIEVTYDEGMRLPE